MISYSLSSLSKSTFFYAGVKKDIFTNINSTPYLVCNRNNFYVIDVLFYLNSLKKILYLVQALTIKKQNLLVLYEGGNYIYSSIRKKIEQFGENMRSINYLKNSNFRQYKDLNLKYFLNNFLRKELVLSNDFYKVSKIYRKPLRFFRGRSKRDFVLTKRSLVFKFYRLVTKILLGSKLKYSEIKKFNIKSSLTFFNSNSNSNNIFLIISSNQTFLYKYFFNFKDHLQPSDFYVFSKNIFSKVNSFMIGLKKIRLVFKSNRLVNRIKSLYSIYNYRKNIKKKKSKIRSNFINSFFLTKKDKKLIKRNRISNSAFLTKKILFLYKKNMKLMVSVKKRLNILMLHKRSKFVFEKINYVRLLNKLVSFYVSLKKQNSSLRNFRFRNNFFKYNMFSSFSNRKLNNFMDVYSSSWVNGSLTNFYGIKNNKLNSAKFPDTFIFISMNNYEGFLREVNYLDLFLIGFLDFYKDFNYVQYYLPTNSSSKDLNLFYFNLLVESTFRGILIELYGYNN